MNYTKGEWRVRANCAEVVTGSSCVITLVYDPSTGRFDTEEAKANANLIAAAPDLLEALRTVLSQPVSLKQEVYTKANEALAKAEGK